MTKELDEVEAAIVAMHDEAKNAYKSALIALGQSAREYVADPDNPTTCRCLIRAALLLATMDLQVTLTLPVKKDDIPIGELIN